MQAQSVRFGGLEGRLAIPENALGAVVLFHAYPLLGGSMSNTLIVSLQRCLFDAHWASLRFNFRGVGRSEGSFDKGVGETEDALSAVSFVIEETGLHNVMLVGWSFGSIIALRAAAELKLPVIAISPPASTEASIPLPSFPSSLQSDGLVITGSEDPVCNKYQAEAVAHSLGADLQIVPDTGHFFEEKMTELCEVIRGFISSQRTESAPQQPS